MGKNTNENPALKQDGVKIYCLIFKLLKMCYL